MFVLKNISPSFFFKLESEELLEKTLCDKEYIIDWLLMNLQLDNEHFQFVTEKFYGTLNSNWIPNYCYIQDISKTRCPLKKETFNLTYSLRISIEEMTMRKYSYNDKEISKAPIPWKDTDGWMKKWYDQIMLKVKKIQLDKDIQNSLTSIANLKNQSKYRGIIHVFVKEKMEIKMLNFQCKIF